MRPDKAHQFMQQARFVAQNYSKDRSTKVGALLVDAEDFTLLSQGYNGMPRGVDESRPERQERPLKYAFYEHAERNAVFNKARRLLKGSLVVTTAQPSLSCARAVISVGAKEIYFPAPMHLSDELRTALELFAETGVTVGYTSEGRVLTQTPTRHTQKISDLAAQAAVVHTLRGKDPQGSATIFLSNEDYVQLTEGYSGLPRGADDARTERYLGELRDMWVESSVRNAIYNAVRRDFKGSVALVTATTCVECARALAAVGVSEVIYTEPTPEFQQRWGQSIDTALELLRELGVTVTPMPRPDNL